MVCDERAESEHEGASARLHSPDSSFFSRVSSALEAPAKIVALAASEFEDIESGESVTGD